MRGLEGPYYGWRRAGSSASGTDCYIDKNAASVPAQTGKAWGDKEFGDVAPLGFFDPLRTLDTANQELDDGDADFGGVEFDNNGLSSSSLKS